MKINRPTKPCISEWHRWFAWYPVQVSPTEYRWLETVLRKGEWNHSLTDIVLRWEYDALAAKGDQ